jgi:hypothetical protein
VLLDRHHRRRHGDCGTRPLPWRRASLTPPLPPLLRLDADQTHKGRITAPHGWQHLPALGPPPRLQAIEPAILDDRHHLAPDRRALDAAQPVAHPHLRHAGEQVIQHHAVGQRLDPVHDQRALQAPGHPRVIPARRWPTPTLGQVWWHVFLSLAHGPPPAAPGSQALRAYGPQITPSATI